MIYVAVHKIVTIPLLDSYVPIQVGATGKETLGYATDDIGDNISEKNPNYCELTALYWIWKNLSDDYKGLVHYRRYFGKSNLSSEVSNIYTYNELLNLLSNADIVLPYVEYFKQNSKEEILLSCCTDEIFNKLEKIVEARYPEYIEAFNQYFTNNKSVLFNMMFCRRELFDSYCKWIFTILFELEDQVDMSDLNDYQKRLYGFLAERLLNVWVKKNQLQAVHVPVVNTEMSIPIKIQLIRRRVINRLRFFVKTQLGAL